MIGAIPCGLKIGGEIFSDFFRYLGLRKFLVLFREAENVANASHKGSHKSKEPVTKERKLSLVRFMRRRK